MIDYKKMAVELKAENRALRKALDRATWGSVGLSEKIQEQKRLLKDYLGRQAATHGALTEALGVEPCGYLLPLNSIVAVFRAAADVERNFPNIRGTAPIWDAIDNLRETVKAARKVVK